MEADWISADTGALFITGQGLRVTVQRTPPTVRVLSYDPVGGLCGVSLSGSDNTVAITGASD